MVCQMDMEPTWKNCQWPKLEQFTKEHIYTRKSDFFFWWNVYFKVSVDAFNIIHIWSLYYKIFNDHNFTEYFILTC